MIYSTNPLKWLLWLCQKIRRRKSKWQLYHCPKPLSKKGYKVVKDRLRMHATGMIRYRGVPFYYVSCFCDRSIGESCEACHPVRGKND